MKNISIIVATAENRVIGLKNKIPWHLPADMKRFRMITTNQTVIMGRKTYESIVEKLGNPLPNRTNIILTRQKDFKADNCTVCNSLEEAVNLSVTKEIFIIGGAEIYRQALDIADNIYMTLIYFNPKGDALFPKINTEWALKEHRQFSPDGKNKHSYSFMVFKRKKKSKTRIRRK